MASQKPKPYTISWPFTAKTAEDIDQTFDILFKQVQLNAPGAGVLPVVLGGTGLGAFTKGDLLYAATATTIAGLHDVAAGSVVLSGGVNAAPAYGKVALSGSTTHIVGTLPVTNGGTGHALYAVGDIVTADTTTTLARVADVATGNALIAGGVGVVPSWGKIGLTTHVSGVLPEANGGTNQSTYAQGDLLYASAANTLAKLPKDANATRYLSNTGTSNAPAWAQVNIANGVTGTLPVANGGTNIASYTSGDLIYATGATTLAKLAIGAANRVLRSDGSAPNWGQVSDDFISGVTEAKIANGTILARVLDDETIEGDWTFSSAAPRITLLETDASANEQKWRLNVEGEQFAIQALSDNEVTANSALIVSRSGASITQVTAGNPWTFSGNITASGTITANGLVDVSDTVRVTDSSAPASGTGTEVGWFPATSFGFILAINRSTSIYQPMRVIGSTVDVAISGTIVASWSTAGHLAPAVDNTYNCGTAALRWALVRGVTITPGDLLFENGWVITEAEKYGISTPGLVVLDANDHLVAFIEEGGRIYADVRPLSQVAHVKTTLEQRTGRPRPPREGTA